MTGDSARGTAPGRRQRALSRAATLARRLLLWGLVSAVLGAPLAVGWALGRTTVQETIGITPATLSFTVRGHSEVRLGIAGTVYVPVSRGPLGVVATVDGPGDPAAGDGDLASFVTPRMLDLYAGFFHDPEPAVQSYVDELLAELLQHVLLADLVLAASGGLLALVLGAHSPVAAARRGRPRLLLVCAVIVAGSCAAGVLLARGPSSDEPVSAGASYALPELAGTVAEGSTTDSAILRVLLSSAVPQVHKLVLRQEDRVDGFQDAATASLLAQTATMAGPRDGETAVLMQSDMHCNTTMIRLQRQVVSLLHASFGDRMPALMAITGDLTTNGTAAEGGCIRSEAAIAQGAPIAAVTGNHESDTSADQMRGAGMQVLDGSVRRLGGLSVLGAGDPSRSELFGATALRGDETEAGMGERLRSAAEDAQQRPQLVLVHEAYAAQSFLRTEDLPTFLADRGSTTTAYDDGVDDVPAAAVFYGHWHRSVKPRVVWNSDGTWTLVMELDTSGGAIDTPTINHFSTPWSPPQQEASFPVVFFDDDTGLVSGYQLYRFATDGTARVLPRVEIGAEIGTPEP